MLLSAGQRLTCFEILGPLGAGAMGEVYRAQDTRLDRQVALKVLPEQLRGDEERQRFEREAKVLASLNHPNVAQVYGIDQVEGTPFITMELVPGEDLASRLSRGPLPVRDALDTCLKIAEGLEAAHEAGVIHRDLKPANVVLTPEGNAKVLDFGLAKPAGSSIGSGSRQPDALLTEKGRMLGTPTYMAPEQARGKPIDKRIDLWAFGCVLYECLTGERAFGGESLGEVLSAVLDREPDWSRLPGGVPVCVLRLLERCLDKNPHTRLRDAGEARIVLGRWSEDEVETVATRRLRTWPMILALLAGALVTAVAFLAMWPDAVPRNPLDGATVVQLTASPANEFDGAISPNGDFIAYGSDAGGVIDVWVAQIDGGKPENLTQGQHPTIDYAGTSSLGFSAEGSHVWLGEAEGFRLLAAPKTGGVFEPFLGPLVVHMDWTRDGSRVVYHTSEPGDPIHVREVDHPEGEPVMVASPGIHQHLPVWSLDEQWIYFVRGNMSTQDMHLWRMRPDGRNAEQLTHEQRFVTFPTPIDENTVLFLAHDEAGSGPWLWSLDVPGGSTRRVSVGTEQYLSLAASKDGRRVLATVARPRAALWRVPILERLAREQDAELLPEVPSLRALAPLYAGGELFYLSSRGSGDGLWMLSEGRARPIWSGPRKTLFFPPSLSPDGRLAAVVRNQGSRMVLSIVSVEDRQILRTFDGPIDVRGSSSWSPGGEWIVIGGIGPDGHGLFKFPSGGGTPERIVAGSVQAPVWSPTEDLIAYLGAQEGPTLPVKAVRSDGTPVRLSSGKLEVRQTRAWMRFLPDGSGLVYMSGPKFTPDLWRLDLSTGRTHQLTALESRGTVSSFDIAPDGKTIVFDRIQQNSDLVLIELPPRDSRR